jgi:hypothetical protein
MNRKKRSKPGGEDENAIVGHHTVQLYVWSVASYWTWCKTQSWFNSSLYRPVGESEDLKKLLKAYGKGIHLYLSTSEESQITGIILTL